MGIVCYALQIYFDFSGYSDMAIGLGRMLGFTFLENFNYPYISRSITEFWRRWHMSLSSWFRDYLYISLGGNRKGRPRTLINLLVVFLLCGLWHGAAWNFMAWGLFHGSFLVFERLAKGRANFIPNAVKHGYALLVVLVGWVLFRSPTLDGAISYTGTLFGWVPSGGAVLPLSYHLTPVVQLALIAGIVGSLPWVPRLSAWKRTRHGAMRGTLEIAGVLATQLVLFASVVELAAGTYNPFIYFRF